MTLMDRPAYHHRPIQTTAALARALRISESELLDVAARASQLYIGPKPKPKKNGGIRYVYDTEPPLKSLLQRINRTFFKQTDFPQYLTGSLSGRDYVANVTIHEGAKKAVTEDIAQFFDCISADHVQRIWKDFFRFGDEVASILTALTTKDGRVFQGTPTSSYLANLAFWDCEFVIVRKLKSRGFRYSRYVDDVAISSIHAVVPDDVRWVIAQIYAMFGSRGFKPKRSKHETLPANKPIRIMGLNANRSTSLPKRERSAIRAQVFQLERAANEGASAEQLTLALNKANGKVSKLQRLHPQEGAALRARIRAVRNNLCD
jgi:retron-type reverse transcriptase